MEDLDLLAITLFRKFARLEYALKAAGFHNGEGAAEANWRGFAEVVQAEFENPKEENLREAINYILAHPPKKQMVVNGSLSWSDVPPQTDLHSDRVLLYVRRVRNNLFHGGKFNGHWFEPERSEMLLRQSLAIIEASLKASKEVSAAYHG